MSFKFLDVNKWQKYADFNDRKLVSHHFAADFCLSNANLVENKGNYPKTIYQMIGQIVLNIWIKDKIANFAEIFKELHEISRQNSEYCTLWRRKYGYRCFRLRNCHLRRASY